ncbi:MAG: glycoside hydrolase family 13 protein, partial [Clostridia bacterium]|nr:glycoside hydrolase family 13 protein [Clostridia bacterium]
RGLYFYHFRIDQPGNSFRLFRSGLHGTNMEDGEKWQITCYPHDFRVPEKMRGGIMYQIFPDRFGISGEVITEGKMQPFRVHGSVCEEPDGPPDGGGLWNTDFYGGNFNGITERLDYIAGLGADAIYLNPVFMALSNHRYDTADYMRPDPMLGTEEDFSRLCSEAEKRGISVILDGVFSHTGSESVYFKDALTNPSSPYVSWYRFERFPDLYDCWWDVKTLPCVNENDPSYVDFIIKNENSVVAKWLRLGAAGFRLDVADELPDGFISAMRSRLRQIKSDAFIIGEVWEDASNKISYGRRREYFTGGELDGVMNYPFRGAILELVKGRIPPSGFAETVMKIYENYPLDALLCSTVFLSSHDTARLRTELGGDLRKIEVAIALQTFLPGIMCVYYGDENGMEGGNDPFNRGFFSFPDDGKEINRVYKRYLKTRREKKALRTGRLAVEAEGSRLSVIRYDGDGQERLDLEFPI